MTAGIGEVTPQSTEVAEVLHDLSMLLRPAEIDWERAEVLVKMAMLRVSMVVSPIPEGARPILLDMSMRAYTNPQSTASETVGPFGRTFRQAGVYLMDNERTDLLALATGATGAFTIRPGVPT